MLTPNVGNEQNSDPWEKSQIQIPKLASHQGLDPSSVSRMSNSFSTMGHNTFLSVWHSFSPSEPGLMEDNYVLQ